MLEPNEKRDDLTSVGNDVSKAANSPEIIEQVKTARPGPGDQEVEEVEEEYDPFQSIFWSEEEQAAVNEVLTELQAGTLQKQ